MTVWEPMRWLPLDRLESRPADCVDQGELLGAAVNNVYQVWVYRVHLEGRVTVLHLSIKNHARSSVRRWRDLQRIKNEVLGAEQEAFEMFPAESRLVDSANQYHLWCVWGTRSPVGFPTRLVSGTAGVPGAVQRPFDYDPDVYLGHVGLLEQAGVL